MLDYWLRLYLENPSLLDAEIRWLIDHQDLGAIVAMGTLLERKFGETTGGLPNSFATMFATSFSGGDLPALYDSGASMALASFIFAGTGIAGAHFGNFQRELVGAGGGKVFKGIRIAQQLDINWEMKDANGRANLERALAGDAPIGPDDKRINLHHVGQKAEGPPAETTATTHSRYSRILHKSSGPSTINRPAFDYFREQYWVWRALEALNANLGE